MAHVGQELALGPIGAEAFCASRVALPTASQVEVGFGSAAFGFPQVQHQPVIRQQEEADGPEDHGHHQDHKSGRVAGVRSKTSLMEGAKK